MVEAESSSSAKTPSASSMSRSNCCRRPLSSPPISMMARHCFMPLINSGLCLLRQRSRSQASLLALRSAVSVLAQSSSYALGTRLRRVLISGVSSLNTNDASASSMALSKICAKVLYKQVGLADSREEAGSSTEALLDHNMCALRGYPGQGR